MFSFIFYFFIFLIILHFINEAYDKNQSNVKNGSFEEAKFLVTLLARLAKSDGRISLQEAELISVMLDEFSKNFKNPQNVREVLKQIFNKEKDKSWPRPREITASYYAKFKPSIFKTQQYLNFFLNLAFIDGEFSDKEEKIIREIGQGLNIPPYAIDEIFIKFKYEFKKSYRSDYRENSNYQKNSNYEKKSYQKVVQKDAYEILGVSREDSWDDIKSSYRKLVRKYHPDFLMGRGADEKIIKQATIKLQEINLAYEELKQKFQK